MSRLRRIVLQHSPPSGGHLSGWPVGVWCGSLLVEVVGSAVHGAEAVALGTAAGPVAQAAAEEEAGPERAGDVAVEVVETVGAVEHDAQGGVAGGARARALAVVFVTLSEAQQVDQAEAGVVLGTVAEEVACRRRVAEGLAQLLVREVRGDLREPVAGHPAEDGLQGLATDVAEPGVVTVRANLQRGRNQLGQLGALGRGDRDVVRQLAEGVGAGRRDDEQEVRGPERSLDAPSVELVLTDGVEAQLRAVGTTEQSDEPVDGAVHVVLVGAQPPLHVELQVEVRDGRVLGADHPGVPVTQFGQALVELLGELRAKRVERGLGGLTVVLLGLLQARVQRLADAGDEVLDGRRLVGDVGAVQQVVDDGRVIEERQLVDQLVVLLDEYLHGLGVPDSLALDELALVVEGGPRRRLRLLFFGGDGFVAHG